MTVGELRAKIDTMRDDLPVVIQINEDGVYTKAYASRSQVIHDFLPDGDGGDDIHNSGFIVVIEADVDGA